MNKLIVICSLCGLFFTLNISFAMGGERQEKDRFLSVIRLISTPGDFDGQVVQAYGVLQISVDKNRVKNGAICADVESARRWIKPNCVLLDSNSISSMSFLKKYSGKYVLVNGLFKRADSVVDIYLGTMEKVQAIEPIENP